MGLSGAGDEGLGVFGLPGAGDKPPRYMYFGSTHPRGSGYAVGIASCGAAFAQPHPSWFACAGMTSAGPGDAAVTGAFDIPVRTAIFLHENPPRVRSTQRVGTFRVFSPAVGSGPAWVVVRSGGQAPALHYPSAPRAIRENRLYGGGSCESQTPVGAGTARYLGALAEFLCGDSRLGWVAGLSGAGDKPPRYITHPRPGRFANRPYDEVRANRRRRRWPARRGMKTGVGWRNSSTVFFGRGPKHWRIEGHYPNRHICTDPTKETRIR